MSRLSIIIPAYNRAHLIGDTLRTLFNQTLPADEIIVVDDGSTDDTSNAAHAAFEEWKGGNVKGTKVPEFRVIRQENAGPAKARNTGFAASNGEFIHFFDSDDLAAPNKHEVQLKALQESGADIAYGPWVKTIIDDGQFTPENHVLQQRGLPSGDLIVALLTNWTVVPHACLFRRSIVDKVGGFPEHLFGTEDQMMFLNCLLAGARVVHSPGTFELYRIGDPGKITAVGVGEKRHVANWSKFLIDADKACQEQGITARKWFGFRGRVWEAIQDLKKYGLVEKDLSLGLKAILSEGPPSSLYMIHRTVAQKWNGLKERITGGRENSSFRAGPLTIDQNHLIKMMGVQQRAQDLP